MRVIITGGRDYRLDESDYSNLSSLRVVMPITSLVCGMARGVDSDAHSWASREMIPIDEHPADWDKHGRAAGPIRNREMAEVADALIAFPGGRGTKNMIAEASRKSIPVIELGYWGVVE